MTNDNLLPLKGIYFHNFLPPHVFWIQYSAPSLLCFLSTALNVLLYVHSLQFVFVKLYLCIKMYITQKYY